MLSSFALVRYLGATGAIACLAIQLAVFPTVLAVFYRAEMYSATRIYSCTRPGRASLLKIIFPSRIPNNTNRAGTRQVPAAHSAACSRASPLV
jgi:hypothetical protein